MNFIYIQPNICHVKSYSKAYLLIARGLTTFALFNIKMTKHSSIIFSHQCDYPNKYIVKVINSKLRNSKVVCRTRINNGAMQLVENELRNPQ
jgi:hypothetical protein